MEPLSINEQFKEILAFNKILYNEVPNHLHVALAEGYSRLYHDLAEKEQLVERRLELVQKSHDMGILSDLIAREQNA
jgi:hypothetical protein